MPNWCFNELTITGPKDDQEEFIRIAAGYNHDWSDTAADGRPKEVAELVLDQIDGQKDLFTEFCFKNFIPIPPRIRQAGYSDPKHGDAGYQWSIKNWGTKWQVSEVRTMRNKRSTTYGFDTAWAPPVPVLEAASKKFPTLRFTLNYEIEGDDKGKIWFRNGSIIKEE